MIKAKHVLIAVATFYFPFCLALHFVLPSPLAYGLAIFLQFSYDISKKTDETNSDNSGEMGTRDSGQGGSDVDLNSLSELPVLDMPGVWFCFI